MNEEKYAEFDLSYAGADYTAAVNSRMYSGTLIVNKLSIGYARYWLILQDQTWRIIGDMPLCAGIKNALASKILAWHGLTEGSETVVSGQETAKTTILLDAMQRVIALKKLVP